MGREDRYIGQDIVVDKYHAPNANYEMTVRDFVMRPEADPGSGPIIISLPPVAEARGRFYSIVVRNADPVNTVTIQDLNDSECWDDFVWDGKCDEALLYSDGMKWHVMRPVKATSLVTGAPGTALSTLAPTTLAPTTGV